MLQSKYDIHVIIGKIFRLKSRIFLWLIGSLHSLQILKKKLKCTQERLAELQSLAEIKSSAISGMPISKIISDKTEYSVIKIIIMKDALSKLCEELTIHIANVDDPIIRMILTYRYVNNYSWQKTAFKIGGAIG